MASGAHRTKAASFASRDQEARSISSDGGGMQYFSLRWNNHPVNLVSGFSGLYNSETLVDVTLAAEGRYLQAHRMLLSACSDYFQSLFSVNPSQHPIVILKDVNFEDLKTVVQFMYNGIVNVSSEKLPAVLKTADTLQIKGLGEKYSESVSSFIGSTQSSATTGYKSGFDSSPSSKLLSVPSHQSGESRQLSTESLPEFLHRSRDLSPRQPSMESTRQCSLDSTGAAAVTAGIPVKRPPSPPCSPSIASSHYRKKFRRISGAGSASSDRGNSMEEEKMVNVSSTVVAGKITPPAIHLSPSRQSSSSTDHESKANTGGVGSTVAKKKRELFSARSSRSGGSNQSSTSEYSREHSFSSKRLESSGSSGQSQSISQSQEEQSSAAGNASTSGLMLGSNNPSSSSTQLLMVPTSCHSSRASLGRTQSAGSEVGGSSTDSHNERSDTVAGKRTGRFCLRRQDCLEKGEGPTDYISPIPTIVRSSPNSPLMSAHYREAGVTASTPPPGSAIVQPSAPNDHIQVQIQANNSLKAECREQPESPPQAPHAHTTPILTKQRSNPLSGGDLGQSNPVSLPPLLPKPPPYSPSHHPQSPASHVGQVIVPVTLHHSGLSSPSNTSQMASRPMTPPTAHKLPSVRVIPDTEPITTEISGHHSHRNTTITPVFGEEPLDLDPTSRSSPLHASAIPDPNRLHPGSNIRVNYGSSSSTDPYNQEAGAMSSHRSSEIISPTPTETLIPTGVTPPLTGPFLPSSSQRTNKGSPINTCTIPTAGTSSSTISTTSSRNFPAHLPSPSNPNTIATPSSSLSVLSSHIPEQFGHCPKARDGPALGCNYCWNTTDANGRILRRKTKYHCPDCQANLCIVPCFQAYHEQLEKDKAASMQQL